MIKISELSSDKGLDVIADLSVDIGEIVADEELFKTLAEVVGKFKNRENLSNAELITIGLAEVSKLLPILLKTHKNNIFGILATMKETTPQEVAKQPTLQTIKEIKEIISDKDFMSFFGSIASSKTPN